MIFDDNIFEIIDMAFEVAPIKAEYHLNKYLGTCRNKLDSLSSLIQKSYDDEYNFREQSLLDKQYDNLEKHIKEVEFRISFNRSRS